MDCQLFERQMQRGVDGQLAPEERDDMLKHADTCPDCAALLQDMTALDSLLTAQLGSIEPPADFAASVMSALPAPYRKPALRVLLPRKQWQRWASAAAAALLVTAGVYGFLPPTQQQVVADDPLHPGIAAILEERRVPNLQPPRQQDDVQANDQPGTQIADVPEVPDDSVLTGDTPDSPENVPENNNTEVQPQPVDSTNVVNPAEQPQENPQSYSAVVDLPKPAAYNPQPEGILSQVLLASYEDCDAILPSLNEEGLVEFYIKYKGATHLWTQTLTAEEAPVYVEQVKSTPTVAEITGSTVGTDADGNTLVSSVSPDGRLLAVSRGGDEPGLWLYNNVEGADAATLLAEQGQQIEDAIGGGKMLSWSPDGNKLLYTNAAGKLFVYYLAEQLPFELYGGTVNCASWADDSMTVVFAGKETKDSRNAIYTILLP